MSQNIRDHTDLEKLEKLNEKNSLFLPKLFNYGNKGGDQGGPLLLKNKHIIVVSTLCNIFKRGVPPLDEN